MPLRRRATAIVLLLLAPMAACGDDSPRSGLVGPEAAVDDAQRALGDLPGVDEAEIERNQEEAEELVTDGLTDDLTNFSGGSITLDDPDAGDPEVPTSLSIGTDDGFSASERARRLFVAMERFDHGVSVTDDGLGINLAGESVDAVTPTCRAIATDPVLGEVQQVAVGTENGIAEISTFSLSSSFGADERTCVPIENEESGDFLQVYTGRRLGDDPASGAGGWPALARRELRDR